MTFEGKPARLRSGALVRCGLAEAGYWISTGDRKTTMPHWTGGIGGLEVVVSPDERFVALFVYSGQSSQGFDVFALEPELVRIGGLGQTRGHGDAPTFSPDGKWLVSWIDCDRRLRESGEWFEQVQDDHATGRAVVDWSRLHAMELPSARLHEAIVGVELPLSTDLDLVLGWTTYDGVAFGDHARLELRMPWGAPLAVALPPPTSITAPQPAL